MAVVLSRLIICPSAEGQERAQGPFAEFYLDEVDKCLGNVLEVATTLDERLARDLRALALEPDPEEFDNEDATNETLELAMCRNVLGSP